MTTSSYDANVNLTIAKEALQRAIDRGATEAELKRAQNHVRNAKAIKAKIDEKFKDSKKKK